MNMYSLHYSCLILIKMKKNRQILTQIPDTKFCENLSRGYHSVLCQKTDVIKLILTFHNFFANMLKNCWLNRPYHKK